MDTLKKSNFELNQNIESWDERYEELANERLALSEQLEVMEVTHNEERLKLEATSAQQTKLIDFLQCKTESRAPKKRKVLFLISLVLLGDIGNFRKVLEVHCTM